MAWTHSSMYMMTRLSDTYRTRCRCMVHTQRQIVHGELVSFVLFVNVLIKPVDKISALLGIVSERNGRLPQVP